MSSLIHLKRIGILTVTISVVGIALSQTNLLPDNALDDLLAPARRVLLQSGDSAPISRSNNPKCTKSFQNVLNWNGGDPFQDISFDFHRNGDPVSCGSSTTKDGTTRSITPALREAYDAVYGDTCPYFLDKYQVESLLTMAINNIVSTCLSVERDGNTKAGFLGYCDMGPKKTPILLDHDNLISISKGGKEYLPCRFHTREGLRISQLQQLTEMASSLKLESSTQQCQKQEETNKDVEGEEIQQQTCNATTDGKPTIHLYAVPAGRVFMFAPSYVGEIFQLPHVPGANDQTIYLEVLSLSPRVFDVFNFFSRDESKDLVDRAIKETSESHRIKRSSTGASGYNVNAHRTSESGFDTHGKTAVEVKKRCFQTLGFDEYIDSHGDGLQILRYNVSKAYNSHMDWIEDKSGMLEHDYNSAGKGGNRFATILLYMSDLGPDDGGETVFSQAYPPGVAEKDRLTHKAALEAIRESKLGDVLERGSWEEALVARCRTRLSIRPHSSRAVLFYSQHPNGEPDSASLHGACPVLGGTKFAANLWVWNTPRAGYPGAPRNDRVVKDSASSTPSTPSPQFQQVVATFQNTGQDPQMAAAELRYQDQHWGKIGHGDPPLSVNTYQGHVWNIYVGGSVVKSWTIDEKNGSRQSFDI